MFGLPDIQFPTFPGVIDETDPGGGAGISESDAQYLALLYEAALDRPADLSGLNFWIDQFESGVNISGIAGYFINSPEFSDAFGAAATLSNADLVDVLYYNVLDRFGEDEGFSYWVGQLDAGMSREEVLTLFAGSAENREGSPYINSLHQDGFGDWVF